jgi:hypothetical protein
MHAYMEALKVLFLSVAFELYSVWCVDFFIPLLEDYLEKCFFFNSGQNSEKHT